MKKKFYLEMNIRIKDSPDSYFTNLWVAYDEKTKMYYASSLEEHSFLFEGDPNSPEMASIKEKIKKDIPTFSNLEDVPEFDVILSVMTMIK